MAALAGLLVILIVAWQYVTVSNVPLSPGWTADTWSYGDQFSLLPLGRTPGRMIAVASPVAFFPLGTVMRRGAARRNSFGMRLALTLFPPSRDLQANFALFVALNSVFWFLVVGALLTSIRTMRRSHRDPA